VKIINIRPTERRMTLSLRQIDQEEGEEEVYTTRRTPSASMTIGEMIGDVFSSDESAEELTDELTKGEEEEITTEEA
jgi:ribosomal protein S1